MLSYDWLKFIALGMAAVIFWLIVLTVTATKITNTQNFYVISHSTSRITVGFQNLLTECNRNDEGGFSYEVIETQVSDLSTVPGQEKSLYEAHLGAETAHLIFMPLCDGIAQTFLNSYYLHLLSVHDFMMSMETYVSSYYTNGDYVNGTLNQQKVEDDFRALIKKNKDKRFKGKNFDVGLLQEYARIEKYANALQEFKGYLSDEYVSYVQMEVKNPSDENNPYIPKKDYVINLCPDNTKMGNLKNYIYYYSGETKDENLKTAESMSVFFSRKQKYSEPAYMYESLIFINKLIRASKTA